MEELTILIPRVIHIYHSRSINCKMVSTTEESPKEVCSRVLVTKQKQAVESYFSSWSVVLDPL